MEAAGRTESERGSEGGGRRREQPGAGAVHLHYRSRSSDGHDIRRRRVPLVPQRILSFPIRLGTGGVIRIGAEEGDLLRTL